MPLQKGTSREIMQHNIREMIKTGHPIKQAIAAAYSESKDADSSRSYDDYGWLEVKGNPISKSGVFPYLGSQIQAPDKDKIYMVYRPEEELNNPDTINSFKLLPFINNHPTTLLGDGMINAEDKGIEGVIGEDIYYDAPYLKGNIKVFTRRMNDSIDAGKIELSPGFKCNYDFTPGIFDGERYDAIQRNIRGNHLALVEEGRSGPDVSVMDHMIITLDAKELQMAEENKAAAGEPTLAEIMETLKTIIPQVQELMSFMEKLKPLEEKEHGESLDEDEDVDAEEKPVMDEDYEEKKDEDKKETAMDTMKEVRALKAKIAKLEKVSAMDSGAIYAEMAKKKDLVDKVSPHIGTFACDSMTYEQVAKYAADKLGLTPPAGQESIAVDAYLHNRKPSPSAVIFAQDAGVKSTGADYLSAQYNKE